MALICLIISILAVYLLFIDLFIYFCSACTRRAPPLSCACLCLHVLLLYPAASLSTSPLQYFILPLTIHPLQTCNGQLRKPYLLFAILSLSKQLSCLGTGQALLREIALFSLQ